MVEGKLNDSYYDYTQVVLDAFRCGEKSLSSVYCRGSLFDLFVKQVALRHVHAIN